MTLPRFAAALAICALTGPGAHAQQSSNRVAAQTDWSVFVEGNPQECWGVSAPKQSVNTRDGREVSVQRGDTLLFVSYRPAQNVVGEVSFTGGYPFADGSTVSLEVGGTTFQLITDGQWAWPATPGDDSQIMSALKRGSSAVVTGRSSRGTQTRDTFSLLGFTAASDEAQRRCNG
jgi:hypothetical protein